ncbi:MAG: putative metalloprotease CJM1_0395 family protein [Myxococcota bacterium]
MDIGFVASALGAAPTRSGERTPSSSRERAIPPVERASSTAGSTAASARGVEVSLSVEAQALLGIGPSASEARGEGAASGASSEASQAGSGSGRPGELTPEEQEEVTRLKKRDAEVRAHENAHKAAAGRHARGGPTYEYERGPDGRRYAVGGEVQIDTSPVPNDPDATILKMRQVRRAALAPAEPSPQDRRVASEAAQQEAAARQEKLAAQREARSARTSDAYTQATERPVGGALDVIA